MAIINRSNIKSLLQPMLDVVFFDYDVHPALWKNIYKQYHGDKAVQYEMEMEGLPLGQIKLEGGPVASGSMGQAYETAYVHQYYGISFQITRPAIMDNKYKSDFPQQAMQLRNSLDTLKNVNGAYIFNNAFNAASTVSDGYPLCSTTHQIKTGTLANTFTNGVQFNEAAIEDAITLIKSWSNYAGIKINLNSIKALVPQARAFDAARVFKSQFRTGTANNDISAIVHDKYMPGGYIVNQFITNPNYWFILTDEANGFKYYLREELDTDFITDINTDNVTVRAIERYSFGCSNWRAVFGARGA